MLLGIVGDTHNNLKNISKICDLFNSQNVDLVIHTGDVTLPKSLDCFEKLNSKLICVFGNNDEDEKPGLLDIARKNKFEMFDEPYFLELDDLKFTVVHDPLKISPEIMKNTDFIFHGHTHRYRLENIQGVTIFNPGECAGFLEGKNKIGLFNTKTRKAETISF